MNDLNEGIITFQIKPPFSVNFQEFRPASQNVASETKLKGLAYRCFEQIQYFTQALGAASHLTLRNMGCSFKHIVLNHYGSWGDFALPSVYIVAFKVCFWILAVGLCAAATTARLYLEKNRFQTESTSIDIYINDGIDPRHIKTSRLALNAVDVPAEIKVDGLMQIYDEINFSNPSAPGYMGPSSRQEGSKIYKVKKLRENLRVFIQKVKKREAFLGTPPAWDTPRLMAFYQQIEDAVRLSIYKAQCDIEAFLSKNGADPSRYTESLTREYNNLLENKARIAIDLAIAGKYCGARYMGEAMNTYYLVCGNTIGCDLNLHDTMVEILAQKRKEIAERQIQKHLGNDTHAYGDYMNSLGTLLQLPGTQNIVEQLSRSVDKPKLLGLFFQEYNVDCIIETIQSEIKSEKGHSFRIKIIDWIKDQIKDWNLEKYQKKSIEITGQAEEILAQKSSDSSVPETLEHFHDLLVFLKGKGTRLPEPEADDWEEFLSELFSLNSAKEWRTTRFTGLSTVQVMTKVQKLKNDLSQERLGEDTVVRLREQIKEKGNFAIKDFVEKFQEVGKIDKIRGIIPLEVDSIKRAIRGDVKIKDLIESQMDIQRRNKLIVKLQLEKLAREGASPEIMEWLLVSQNILLTQV